MNVIVIVISQLTSDLEKINEILSNFQVNLIVQLTDECLNKGQIMIDNKTILNTRLLESIDQYSNLLLSSNSNEVIKSLNHDQRKLIGLINVLCLFNKHTPLHGKFDFYISSLSNIMHLDLNTLSNLNIINCNQQDSSLSFNQSFNYVERNIIIDKRSLNYKKTEKSNVFDILNCCSTKFGSRFLRQQMLSPVICLDTINKKLDFTEVFLSSHGFNLNLRSVLYKLPDIQRILRKLELYQTNYNENIVKLTDLNDVKNSLFSIEHEILPLFSLFKSTDSRLNLILNDYFKQELHFFVNNTSKLRDFLIKSILFDEKEREVKVNFEINSDLKKIQVEIDRNWKLIDDIIDETNRFMNETNEDCYSNVKTTTKTKRKGNKVKGVSIVEYKENFVLNVIKSELEILNSHSSIYSLVGSTKNNSYYTTKSLTSISNALKSLIIQYKSQSDKLHSEILRVVCSYIPQLTQIIYVLSEIDMHSSFAYVISQNKSNNQVYTRPILTNEKTLTINQGRHFILDQNLDLIVQNYNKTSSYFIANDTFLDFNSRVLLLTGINMGGKTTYLRQVGLIVYLSHIGMYIPAEKDSIIPITDRIITRVGADDNLLKGMSTFYKEMTEVSSMLSSATEKSILLIDEIGRGTSTIDGISLSSAILYEISCNVRSLCIFASHFHELTYLKIEGVENYYIDYRVNEELGLDIKYRLVTGRSKVSLGLELIKSLNIKELEEELGELD